MWARGSGCTASRSRSDSLTMPRMCPSWSVTGSEVTRCSSSSFSPSLTDIRAVIVIAGELITSLISTCRLLLVSHAARRWGDSTGSNVPGFEATHTGPTLPGAGACSGAEAFPPGKCAVQLPVQQRAIGVLDEEALGFVSDTYPSVCMTLAAFFAADPVSYTHLTLP